jgi:hypothetical protein
MAGAATGVGLGKLLAPDAPEQTDVQEAAMAASDAETAAGPDTTNPEEAQGAATQASFDKRQRAKLSRGQTSTALTGALGLSSPATTNKKTLLGQ